MSIFGDRLREERERTGMSARELSRLAGVNPHHAGKIERGLSRAVAKGAEAMVGALGLGLADLLLDGPPLFEIEFDVADDDLPPAQEIEQAMLRAVPSSMLDRVAVWPWTGDGHVRLRARASCLPGLAALTGARIDELGQTLPAPTVRPVSPSPELVVLIRADGSRAARRLVLAQAAREDCCPPLVVVNRGPALWLARLRAVPVSCSMSLQRLAPESPVGLFVPVL